MPVNFLNLPAYAVTDIHEAEHGTGWSGAEQAGIVDA